MEKHEGLPLIRSWKCEDESGRRRSSRAATGAVGSGAALATVGFVPTDAAVLADAEGWKFCLLMVKLTRELSCSSSLYTVS